MISEEPSVVMLVYKCEVDTMWPDVYYDIWNN